MCDISQVAYYSTILNAGGSNGVREGRPMELELTRNSLRHYLGFAENSIYDTLWRFDSG